MDTEGRIFLINGSSGADCRHFTSQLNELGYQTETVGIEQCGRQLPRSHLSLKVLYVDKPIPPRNLTSFQSGCGLVNMLAARPKLLDQQPELSDTAAELCMLPCGSNEVGIRLQRSISMLGKPQRTDTGEQLIQQNLIGQADCFRAAMEVLRCYADIDAPVLISGETGTGKELVARALHYCGRRSAMPFQTLNCGALPDHLVENELFGHARGAYTDAKSHQEGLVALADGGTLFFDEIDSLSHKAQAALLRFLQDGQYRPLGGSSLKKADVRIISASNRDLDTMVQQGLFRNDLIFRLNILPLELPALRDRSNDIIVLANYFLNKCEIEFKKGKRIFHSSLNKKLLSYHWPGNVRELRSYVQRAYLLSNQSIIVMEPGEKTLPPVSEDEFIRDVKSVVAKFSPAKKKAVDQFESQYVSDLLKHTKGNISQAAKLAGKERRVFGRLVKKHHIDKTLFRAE